MRVSARAFASVVWMVVAAAMTGCAAGPRPDAFVTRAVETEDERRFEEVMLASADDELPIGLPVDGRGAVAPARAPEPQPAARVAGGGSPDRFFDPAPEHWPGSYIFAFQPEHADIKGRPAGRKKAKGTAKEEPTKGLPNLRFEVFQLHVAGRPVKLKASIKNKHLMFAARIQL